MEELSTIENIMANWEMYLGYALAIMAGMDKVFLVAIKTVDNIRDAFVTAFPGKPKVEKLDISDAS